MVYDRGRQRVWRPDFTLPAYNGLIVEYAGMMDVPDYADGIRHKQRAYSANKMPAVFVYPRHLQGRDWPAQLAQYIHDAAQRAGRYK